MYRTHTCGELRAANIDQKVNLSGWVQRVRDKGHMIWVVLRDRYGETQLFFEEGKTSKEVLDAVRELGREYVVKVSGTVVQRQQTNPNQATGEIEVVVDELDVLNASKTPPFTIEDETDGGEELRMRHRYLDLRRKPMRDNILLRHRVLQMVRNYLSNREFVEIETPFLIKSTPEGARDFVVPSRLHEGEFYALPQSPQTFKQLLMISGFERYFQLVKCFRDEDFRADRQPEFTQIDCELSFIEEEDIMEIFGGLISHIFLEEKNVDFGTIDRMTYQEAVETYGTDRPDLRYGMEIRYLTDLLSETDFPPFKQAIESGGCVAGIKVEGAAGWSRKQLDRLTDFVRNERFGMKGLIWMKADSASAYKSSVDKFFSEESRKSWAEHFEAQSEDLILILAEERKRVQVTLGELRIHLAKELGLRNSEEFFPIWVTDFPLVEWNEDENRFDAMHHPFTAPNTEDLSNLNSGNARSRAYDLVINGMEVGGGSIRIHSKDVQEQVFGLLGIDKNEAREKFGFLLDALEHVGPATRRNRLRVR